jgi:hypothetical protein
MMPPFVVNLPCLSTVTDLAQLPERGLYSINSTPPYTTSSSYLGKVLRLEGARGAVTFRD